MSLESVVVWPTTAKVFNWISSCTDNSVYNESSGPEKWLVISETRYKRSYIGKKFYFLSEWKTAEIKRKQ
jgi:hypothetical protein